MRGLIQRVRSASVTVTHPPGADGRREQELAGRIGPGLCVLVGVTHDDDPAAAAAMASKIWNLRVFDDADGVMNLSAADLGREVLVVSQFTLYGDTRKGRRPSYVAAARPEVAEPLVQHRRRHAVAAPLQLAEAERAVAQLPDDAHRPAPPHQVQQDHDRAAGARAAGARGHLRYFFRSTMLR